MIQWKIATYEEKSGEKLVEDFFDPFPVNTMQKQSGKLIFCRSTEHSWPNLIANPSEEMSMQEYGSSASNFSVT